MNEELRDFLLPPIPPLEAPPPEEWSALEASFTGLPDDYKLFIERYGTGFVSDGYLSIFNPFSTEDYLNLLFQSKQFAAAYGALKADFPKYYDFPIFPADCGLLPFGISIDGAYLTWVTGPDPNSWQVAVVANVTPRIETFPMGMTEWLHKLLSKRTRCVFFPSDFPVSPRVFTNQ